MLFRSVGLLVLSDTYLDGWTCAIDGEKANILRVDHALRGVQLPAKSCRVRFAYQQPGLMPGLAVGAAGVVLLVALVVLAMRARRSPQA